MQDSAEWYENEKEVGRAILDWCKETNTPREAIFYTTKLKYNRGYDKAKAAMKKSVEDCGLGYIDLYLLHGPIGGSAMRMASWKAAIDSKKEGLFRNIGVSCFSKRHLSELLDAGLEVPTVNQVCEPPQLSAARAENARGPDRPAPFHDADGNCRVLPQTQHRAGGTVSVHAAAESRALVLVLGLRLVADISVRALQAWAPLVRGLRFRHSKIVALAEKYSKDPAHVLLRWSLQKARDIVPHRDL